MNSTYPPDTWKPGEPRPPFVISSAAMRACPTHRFDAGHYRPDGTCMCVPPADATLEPHIIRGEG